MKIELDIGLSNSINRKAVVRIAPGELQSALLHIAFADARNRTGLYMRRHRKLDDAIAGISVGPNRPLRSPLEPEKLSIADYFRMLRKSGNIPPTPSNTIIESGDTFCSYPAMLAVPISDLVANLLRPCFFRKRLGVGRAFFFEDEPIDCKIYWAACFFRHEHGVELHFMDIKIDPVSDTVFSVVDGKDLINQGLEWAAALVPLVKYSNPVSLREIAQNDYDLRQVFGRTAESEIEEVYKGWYETWDQDVASLVTKYVKEHRSLEVFYHSILALHRSGEIRIYQMDGTLPDLAKQLASEGNIAAGLLDSGGSCAIFDPWLGSYLNHGWYFREKRGAVIIFELKARERIPGSKANTWAHWSHDRN